jgi:adenine phosphoribosyltransferase
VKETKIQQIQKLFNNFPVNKTKTGYPYVLFPLTDYTQPMHPKTISIIADLIIKQINPAKIDIIVSESDRGGGPIAQEVSRKLNKPFILANWYVEKINSGERVKTKIGFSGEGYIYLLGIKKGQNILIVDDLISSGGTLIALIESIKKFGAKISDVVCVGEKVDQKGSEKIKEKFGISVKTLVKFSAEGTKTKVIIDKTTKENKFWKSEKALKYELFNIALPSEIVAYNMTYKLTNLKNKIVLDYGCYNGNSSATILNQGAKKVIGIDSSLKSINEAKKNQNKKNLEFMHVKKDEEINVKTKFDICTNTFVHPVINNKKELENSFKKINKVLKKEGILITLGLNPNAFNKKYAFKYYDFNKKKNNQDLNDEDYFENNLYLPDKSILKLKDVFWSEKTLTDLIKQSGFKIESIIHLNKNNIPNKHKKFFIELEQKIAKQFNITWLDEWKAPLYQIIIAKKK